MCKGEHSHGIKRTQGDLDVLARSGRAGDGQGLMEDSWEQGSQGSKKRRK